MLTRPYASHFSLPLLLHPVRQLQTYVPFAVRHRAVRYEYVTFIIQVIDFDIKGQMPMLGETDLETKTRLLLLVVSVVIGAVLLSIRGGRHIVGWLVMAGMIGGGTILLLQERQGRIDTATENIVAELDALDPVARAQVLKALAEEEVDRIKPG